MLSAFSGGVNPVAVRTMQLLAGDESLQFYFVDRVPANSIDVPQRIGHQLTFGADKVLRSTFPGSTSGVLQHMTVGSTEVKSFHAPTDYRYWTLPPFVSPPLDAPQKRYYLYARCGKSDDVGAFVLSEAAIGMEAITGCYHFLVALVNSEQGGERSVAALYGFSEILPGRITTDRLVSSDGKTYVDLAGNEVGGRLNFKDGLISSMIALASESTGEITAGLQGDSSEEVGAWFGGTYQDALDNKAGIVLRKNGTGYIGNVEVEGDGDLSVNGGDRSVIVTNRKVSEIPIGGADRSASSSGHMELVNMYSYLESTYPKNDNGASIIDKQTGTVISLPAGTYRLTLSSSYGIYMKATTIGKYASISCRVRLFNEATGFVEIAGLGATSSELWPTNGNYEKERTGSDQGEGVVTFDRDVELCLKATGSAWLKDSNANVRFFLSSYKIVASPIVKLTALCADGLIVSYDKDTTFVVSNSGNRVSIKAKLPEWNKANVGELCVRNDGIVVIQD